MRTPRGPAYGGVMDLVGNVWQWTGRVSGRAHPCGGLFAAAAITGPAARCGTFRRMQGWTSTGSTCSSPRRKTVPRCSASAASWMWRWIRPGKEPGGPKTAAPWGRNSIALAARVAKLRLTNSMSVRSADVSIPGLRRGLLFPYGPVGPDALEVFDHPTIERMGKTASRCRRPRVVFAARGSMPRSSAARLPEKPISPPGLERTREMTTASFSRP